MPLKIFEMQKMKNCPLLFKGYIQQINENDNRFIN